MDQEQRFRTVIGKIEEHIPLEAVELDPELAEPKSILQILRVNCYNWRAERLKKVHTLRFTVKRPSLDALNMIIYPDPSLDAPIFLFFFLLTKRKVVCHFNVNNPFTDNAYQAKWVDPLTAILKTYPPFDVQDRYPDWMKRYKNSCTIYGLFEKDRLDDLTACAMDYLDVYLPLLAQERRVDDFEKLDRIQAFHEQFKNDIRTQDKAQGMISKFIGKEKSRRIFYEVTT